MHFDMLAEMVKFNRRAFHRLSRAIGPARTPAFLSALRGSLVDSNVVVRSVVLTMEHDLQRRLLAEALRGEMVGTSGVVVVVVVCIVVYDGGGKGTYGGTEG